MRVTGRIRSAGRCCFLLTVLTVQALVQAQESSPEKLESEKSKAAPLEEVVVTGTHIRGVSPAAQLIVLTSADIASSGATTAGDVLRTLPQSFAGGQQSTIGTNGFGPWQNLSNFNNSDSANLRGFGSDSTLVLVNGMRAPVTGFQGSVDISAIPLNAIDHVEIVTDGASALYGSDAVGGVVNFVLRKDFSGAETSGVVGYPTDGGGVSQRYGQLVGRSWDTGSVMLAYQYRDQSGLYGNQRDWWTGPNPYSLVGSIHQNSVHLDFSQLLSPDLRVFAQTLYNRTTSFNLVTHAGTLDTDILPTIGYSYVTSLGATLTLPRGWALTASGDLGADRFDHHDSEPCCAFDIHIIPTNRLALGELQAEGPVIRLPSGDVRAALGGGYRHESLDSISYQPASAVRHIDYGYGELTVPLLGTQDARGVRGLTLSLAGRYERYSDIGSHFSPEVGLTLKPTSELKLRATWNKSFHAPDLYEKYSHYFVFINFPLQTPGGGMTNTVIPLGGNPSLEPESARSYTLGLDWQPTDVPLRINATYFNISYTNRILQAIVDPTLVLLDPTFAPLVTLNPSVAAQEALINGTTNPVLNITGAPFDPTATGAIIDDRFRNVTAQTATGADLRATWEFTTGAGTFSPFFNGNILSLRQQLTSASPVQTVSGLVFYPSKYKLRGGLSWQRYELGGTATFNYAAAETNNLIQPETRIGAWYTLDLQGRYASSASSGPAKGLSVRLALINVFDRSPPIVTGYAYVYDNAQASPYGRIVQLEIAKKW